MPHLLDGQCTGRDAPGCSDVARGVRSPLKMALMITGKALIVLCERKQVSLDVLRMCCSAIGVTTARRPEYAFLMYRLKYRRNALPPLLDYDGLGMILCGVEALGKQSLQNLITQHNLSVDQEHNTESMKATAVVRIPSGMRQASTSGLCTSIHADECRCDEASDTYLLFGSARDRSDRPDGARR